MFAVKNAKALEAKRQNLGFNSFRLTSQAFSAKHFSFFEYPLILIFDNPCNLLIGELDKIPFVNLLSFKKKGSVPRYSRALVHRGTDPKNPKNLKLKT